MPASAQPSPPGFGRTTTPAARRNRQASRRSQTPQPAPGPSLDRLPPPPTARLSDVRELPQRGTGGPAAAAAAAGSSRSNRAMSSPDAGGGRQLSRTPQDAGCGGGPPASRAYRPRDGLLSNRPRLADWPGAYQNRGGGKLLYQMLAWCSGDRPHACIPSDSGCTCGVTTNLCASRSLSQRPHRQRPPCASACASSLRSCVCLPGARLRLQRRRRTCTCRRARPRP